ncbi:hypothetical protein GOP47_0008550 [Adiantum capillus-veneris]|uniref:Glutaredoxin domain-containing protein n=1 Tax=Adiantum capillus-veneris TaxID=13818 RepID=A0A9D4UYK2_ADICA|nr:hypothetical protein GOP47_0008550 [Adiantum capillus-veneris]
MKRACACPTLMEIKRQPTSAILNMLQTKLQMKMKKKILLETSLCILTSRAPLRGLTLLLRLILKTLLPPGSLHLKPPKSMQTSSRALVALLRGSASSNRGAWSSLQRQTPRSFCSSGGELDTHSDFKPIHKPPEDILSVKDQIQKDVKENPVLLYMKGVPDAPQCGFSAMATQILKVHGVPFAARNILEDMELRQAMKTFSNWPTFPQLYINGEFVGGSDILKKMHESGELEEMLKSVPRKKAHAHLRRKKASLNTSKECHALKTGYKRLQKWQIFQSMNAIHIKE